MMIVGRCPPRPGVEIDQPVGGLPGIVGGRGLGEELIRVDEFALAGREVVVERDIGEFEHLIRVGRHVSLVSPDKLSWPVNTTGWPDPTYWRVPFWPGW